MNAIQVSPSFPPHDPWMAGETLNYYYLGHLLLAAPAHVLGLEPSVGYNLAVAGLFALSRLGAVHALGHAVGGRAGSAPRAGRWGPGWPPSGSRSCSGTWPGSASGCDAKDPPGDYDWFGASRVIKDTINEIPSFSFTLGDLHAHVLAIPFTALALAFALQVAIAGPRGDVAWRSVAEALAAGLSVGVMYAINSWSYPVVAGLLVAAVVVWMREPTSAGRRAYGVLWTDARGAGRDRADAAVLAELRRRGARHRPRHRARLVRALGRRPGADLRHRRLAGGRGLREPRARHLAAAAHGAVERGGGRVRALAAGARRAVGDRAAAGARRGGDPRAALDAPRRRRALPVGAAGGRGRLLAAPRADLRPRRVRRQRPVPHEHRLQDGLPGLPAAGDRRGLRDPVGRALAAPPRVGRAGRP